MIAVSAECKAAETTNNDKNTIPCLINSLLVSGLEIDVADDEEDGIAIAMGKGLPLNCFIPVNGEEEKKKGKKFIRMKEKIKEIPSQNMRDKEEEGRIAHPDEEFLSLIFTLL